MVKVVQVQIAVIQNIDRKFSICHYNLSELTVERLIFCYVSAAININEGELETSLIAIFSQT